jgi:hypothetical protein
MHGDKLRTTEVKQMSLQIDGGHLKTEEATCLILEIDEGQLKTVEETTNWALRSKEAS